VVLCGSGPIAAWPSNEVSVADKPAAKAGSSALHSECNATGSYRMGGHSRVSAGQQPKEIEVGHAGSLRGSVTPPGGLAALLMPLPTELAPPTSKGVRHKALRYY